MNFFILNTDSSTDTYINNLELAGENGEITLGEIIVPSEGVDFLVDYLESATEERLLSIDHLVPSHDAPHVIAQAITKLFDKMNIKWKMIDFPTKIATPYEIDLETGLKAVSYATEKCPSGCVEPEICLVTKKKLDWDVGKEFQIFSEKCGDVNFIGFECKHLVRKVATIPLKEVVKGWLEIKENLLNKMPFKILIGTHSKCHGIAALIEVD